MRVAVVDIGTNSTRLLIADVGDGVTELERESVVTRLGDGVDATGGSATRRRQRVFAVLDRYAAAIAAHGCEASAAVLTSAVRDAANGAAFAAAVRERYGLEARTLSGDEEAAVDVPRARPRPRPADDPTERLVIDIGGGSTELVCGARGALGFHVSTQIGVVRHTERHLHGDPPTRRRARRARRRRRRRARRTPCPRDVRARAERARSRWPAPPTSCAAIDLELEPYDPPRVEGHVLAGRGSTRCSRALAALPLAERRARPRPASRPRADDRRGRRRSSAEVLDAFGLDASRSPSATSSGASRWGSRERLRPAALSRSSGFWTFVRWRSLDTEGYSDRRRAVVPPAVVPRRIDPGDCRIDRRLPPPGSSNGPQGTYPCPS